MGEVVVPAVAGGRASLVSAGAGRDSLSSSTGRQLTTHSACVEALCAATALQLAVETFKPRGHATVREGEAVVVALGMAAPLT